MHPGWLAWPARPICNVKQARKRASPPFRWYLCAIANHFFGDLDFHMKNVKFFCGRPSRPWLCIQLSLTARQTNFKIRTSLEARIPMILMILVCNIANHFWGFPDSDIKMQINFWMYVKTLAKNLVGTHGQFNPFEGKTSLEVSITSNFDDFRVL